MIPINFDEAKKHLSILGGETFTFQVFADREDSNIVPKNISAVDARSRNHYFTLLEKDNNAGAGIFVTVNETDGKGRKYENITRVRSLFADLDGAPLDNLCRIPLQPHMIIESSPGKYHPYWLVSDFPKDRFTIYQKRIAELIDGDIVVNDLPRVLRLAGFIHRKGEAFQTRIIQHNDMPPYSLSEIIDALGDVSLDDAPPPPERKPIVITGDFNGRHKAYVLRALEGEVKTLQDTPDGRKFAALRRAAYCMGGYSYAGLDCEGTVERLVGCIAARCKCEKDARRTARLAFEAGAQNPRPMPKDLSDKARTSTHDQKPNENAASPKIKAGAPPADSALLQRKIDALSALNQTDDGNARAIVELYGDRIRYVHQAGIWRVYDRRWHDDLTGEVERLAVKTAKQLYEAAGVSNAPAKDRQRMASWAIRSESQSKVSAVLNALQRQPEIATLLNQWDRDKMLLGLQEGAIDLKTGSYLPPDPTRLISKAVGCEYDPTATAPRTDNFLFEICGADPDLDAFIRRAIGYSLTGMDSEQCFMVLHGNGKNGKGTLLKTLKALLNEYAVTSDFESFTEQKFQKSSTNDIARLAGVRFVSAQESKENCRLAEGTVKKLTGGDPINARFLYHEDFEFRPEFKLWLACNHKPIIKGTDDGIWRRIRLIPFTQQFDVNQEPGLEDMLLSELPGLLNMAISYSLQWQSSTLGAPESVKSATQNYRGDMDIIGQFIDDCIKPNTLFDVPAKNLYDKYVKWCEQNGERCASQRALGLKLKERGFFNQHGRNGDFWKGLSIISDIEG